jgi:hypothetical protein
MRTGAQRQRGPDHIPSLGKMRYQEDSPARPLLGDGISEVEGRRTTLSWLYRRPSDPVADVIKQRGRAKRIKRILCNVRKNVVARHLLGDSSSKVEGRTIN